MRRAGRIVGRTVAAIVAALVLLVAVVVGNGVVIGVKAQNAQESRLAEHRARVAVEPSDADWTDPAGDSPVGDGSVTDALRINELQTIATHNSYISEPNALQFALIGLVEPSRVAPLKYSHPPIWDQLDEGVRSIELDLRHHRNGGLSISHAPLTANGGNTTDFELALDEITLWSQSHPGHLPITVLLEFKNDYTYLDWTLDDFDAAALDSVDDVIVEHIGADRLFSPDDMRGTAATVNAAVTAGDWPTVAEARGTVMFVMYPDEDYRPIYASDSMQGRAMFTSVAGDSADVGAADVAVVVQDIPDAAVITPLVQAGYLVRTRTDTDLVTDPDERDTALASGAQIVSTDFTAARPQEGTDYAVEFDDGATVRKNPVLAAPAG